MPIGFDWVDAFTAQPFAGNGCAVIHDADGLPDDLCMAITRETGLVECTFLCASDRADVRIRYFMANREIPFAGHPTVASVTSLYDRGLVSEGDLTVETGAGVVPVRIETGAKGVWVSMVQNAPDFGPYVPEARIAALIGLPERSIAAPPRVVSTGLPFVVTLLDGQESLAAARLDAADMQRFQGEIDYPDPLMEPFLVTLGGATPEGDTFSRLLLAPPLPPEDPFTGSATGAMAAYLWSEGLIDQPAFIAEQGHWMNRPGQARVEVLGPRDAITGVRVAGQGYVLMRGFLNLG
ncbi:PhzF family phenazine biosynthesis protein [Anianabacter salinae]|uniref:PhzF family phenazine biosynthesis protein n=1 Tax=Anianabacter salinae TaxID=2851023 RepID=UPI00225DEE35|nr:PhzF family phenazine biosynthesis protein [Anianabacter salinae]MBV0911236.1 PhzF family phenazine biosynthesis protein [Anianabacter salinae]